MSKRPNRLVAEKSPYLLQHAHNPVDWRPWGEEAFAQAKAAGKPLFLSIGYSTCHWCHVMERECFEDGEAAALLNEVTVPVKIDREERPDLDGVYMAACQLMTGAGGWPLSIFVDHGGRPFYAATYIPKQSRFGRTGLMDLLGAIREAWANRKADIDKAASNVALALGARREACGAQTDLGPEFLARAYSEMAQRYDPEHGGFGPAPKFPSPHKLLFLLRHHARTGDPLPLEMAARTLTAMRLGGIFDHVGLGFHRYSTDERWFLPHFEKMLYDQAMLLMAYTEGFLATGDETFKRTALEIFQYVVRELTSPEGGFLSAEDADSDGEEGKFYVWTSRELREVLTEEQAGLYEKTFGFTPQGNFAGEATGEVTGANIPFLASWPGQDIQAQLEEIRFKLFDAREARIHPHKDDKILTDWNGLMIAALAKAGRALGKEAPVRAAERAASFVLERLRDSSGRLLHRYREGDAAIPGVLDDYAFLAWGLTELYQATFAPHWLTAALELTDELLARFQDAQDGGFFFTAHDAEALLARQKEFYDAAIPSGNSAAMYTLVMLSRLAGRPDLAGQAHKTALAAGESLARLPSGFAMLLSALDLAMGPGNDVVLCGADQTSLYWMLEVLRSAYLPGTLVMARTPGMQGVEALPAYTAHMRPVDGKATAYVCRGASCLQPVTDPAALRETLR